tara:strand:- start:6939 stop:9005 length:2067 start_codon:yes stop_codon:yes gene_type:complete
MLATLAHAENHQMEFIEVRAASLEGKGLALDAENSAASRLGLSIQDIPASVSVINKAAIAIKGDFSGLSAVTRAPGFASSASPGNGGTATSVRGFNGHSSVVYTYDGTRLYVGAGTVSFPADTWTVDRIEVLRGPGSVINGVGAIGATVNYVPKKPAFKPVENEIAVTVGSFNLQRYALGSGGQINTQLAYRFDAVNHSTDGYVDRADEERRAVAGALLFKPSDTLTLQLSIDYADTDAAPYWGTPLVDGDIPGNIRKNNYNVADGLVEYEDLWPRLHLEWDLTDHIQLRSDTYYLTAERHWRNVESYDYNPGSGQVDRSFYLEILHEQEQLGHRSDLLLDLNLGGMHNRLSVGLEINQIDFSHINNRPYEGTTSVSLSGPNPGSWAEGVGSETSRDFDSETFQYAVFIDNVLELNEEWHLVAGIRQDEIDFEREDLARSNGEPADFIDTTFSGTSWRLGGVYKPTENTSLYLQYSTAVDAIQSLLSASNPDLDLAKGRQVEVGLKQQWLEGRLQYTLSLYDITKSDLISNDPGGIQRQIGEQSSRGVEFELFWLPIEVLSIDFNLALTRPEYEQFISGSDNYSGNVPRNVPEKTANLWLTWQVAPAWSVAGGARYVGERYLDDTNTAELPDYTVFDATLQWQLSDNTHLSLRGKNLGDSEDYVLAPYGSQWVLADGRSVELGMHYDF